MGISHHDCNARFEAPVNRARRRARQTGGPFPCRFRRRGRRLDVSPRRIKTELVEGAQSLSRADGRSTTAPAGVFPVQVVSWLLDADVHRMRTWQPGLRENRHMLI